MFDSLLEDYVNIIPHEDINYLEVFPKPNQNRAQDRLDQQLILDQLKDSLLKDKTDLIKLDDLHDWYLTETFYLLKLVLRVDCFDVESIDDVAFEKIMVVTEDVHQDDRLFVQRGL